jgi:hypothetical protein
MHIDQCFVLLDMGLHNIRVQSGADSELMLTRGRPSTPLNARRTSQRGAITVEYLILIGVIAISALSAFRLLGRTIVDAECQSISSLQGMQGTPGEDRCGQTFRRSFWRNTAPPPNSASGEFAASPPRPGP